MVLVPLHGHGCNKTREGQIQVDWESEENLRRVRERVTLLLKGCGCKTGCTTNRCSCKKGEKCGPGYRCRNCSNDESSTLRDPVQDVQLEEGLNEAELTID